LVKVTKNNPHTEGSFDDFLRKDGTYEVIQARALKQALAEHLDYSMQIRKLSEVSMQSA